MHFDEEAILALRTEQLARAEASAGQLLRLPSHVQVRLADRTYALPLARLRGAGIQLLTPVPLSSGGWLGVTQFLEEVWPVRWLGDIHPPFRSRVFVLFLNDRRLGLAVEENLGLLSVELPEGGWLGTVPGLDFLKICGYAADQTMILEVS